MKFIKKLFSKITQWITSLFTSRKKTTSSQKNNEKKEVIGTAVFDGQHYLFVRKKKSVFLVSDTKHHSYSQQIIFGKNTLEHIDSMEDLDAVTLSNGEYALVATIFAKGEHHTVYFISKNSTHFEAILYFNNPNGQPHKIVINDRDEIFVLSSLDGKIHYKKIDPDYLYHEYELTPLGPRDNSFDHGPLRIVGAMNLPDGIFVLYEVSYEFPGYQTHRFGGALLAHDNLSHVHWRAFHDEIPFWENFTSRTDSDINLKSIGAYFKGEDIKVLFFDSVHGDIHSVELHQPYHRRDIHPHKAYLKKYANNPILRPNSENNWECFSTFNPTAIEIDDVTHLLYRAEGSAGLSVIGHGKSYNGVTFSRIADPIYVPRMDFEGVGAPKKMVRGRFKSGYNHYPVNQSFEWHGVEDPRITELDGHLYMIYAAYNGYQMARPAITSIAKDDFIHERWDKWKTPQPMTEQPEIWGEGNKNVVLFPEKVNGKYMLFHRIWPHIRIDYVDSLEFGPGKQYLKELEQIPARGDSWDSNRVGVSSAPIRIDEGWLMVYQGAGSQDRKYKVGAMILDHDDPSKVLYRSNYPIMIPDQWYENDNKAGVAYPCGAVVKDGMLNVYYGGSDKYVCLAQAPLDEFVAKLKQDPYKKPELQKEKNIRELCT